MGGIFARTYFPHGYTEWITETQLNSTSNNEKDDDSMNDEMDEKNDNSMNDEKGNKSNNDDKENKSNNEIMSEETYNSFVLNPQAREIILEISKKYDEYEQKIVENRENFIIEIGKDLEVARERLVYDVLVSKVICDFWLKLLDQPRETIKNFYKQNVPNIEEIFHQVEQKYNLTEFCTADLMISTYKRMTC